MGTALSWHVINNDSRRLSVNSSSNMRFVFAGTNTVATEGLAATEEMLNSVLLVASLEFELEHQSNSYPRAQRVGSFLTIKTSG